ncbi:hypothetical protein D3C71_2035060 [compost metagenome]
MTGCFRPRQLSSQLEGQNVFSAQQLRTVREHGDLKDIRVKVENIAEERVHIIPVQPGEITAGG